MIRLPDETKLSVQSAGALLRRYWADNPAVWELFESSLTGDRDAFEPLDVLSLNALNVRMTMGHMTEFWTSDERQRAEALLREVPHGDVTQLTDTEVEKAAAALATVADCVSGVAGWHRGGTRVGKLLYRMRPGLAPIWDRDVGRSYYPTYRHASWAAWYPVAMNGIKANAADLRKAIARCHGYHTISPVRAWDIILWSQATTAAR